MADLHNTITNKLEEVCEKLNWNSMYLDEYTSAAAVKASALFQALGYEYGDRTPSVYKIQDVINECFISVGTSIARNVPKGNYNDVSCSTGMFKVEAYFEEWGEGEDGIGQWQFEVMFDLIEFAEHRIKEN